MCLAESYFVVIQRFVAELKTFWIFDVENFEFTV